jgi:hypothetical protein
MPSASPSAWTDSSTPIQSQAPGSWIGNHARFIQSFGFEIVAEGRADLLAKVFRGSDQQVPTFKTGRNSAPLLSAEFWVDAQNFQRQLRERFAQFNLELAEEKTRLLLFGRFAAVERRKHGQRPETFEFLGSSRRSRTASGFQVRRYVRSSLPIPLSVVVSHPAQVCAARSSKWKSAGSRSKSCTARLASTAAWSWLNSIANSFQRSLPIGRCWSSLLIFSMRSPVMVPLKRSEGGAQTCGAASGVSGSNAFRADGNHRHPMAPRRKRFCVSCLPPVHLRTFLIACRERAFSALHQIPQQIRSHRQLSERQATGSDLLD